MFVRLSGLPVVQFAHVYGATDYRNSFSPAKHFMEITYVSAGTVKNVRGNKETLSEKGEIHCLLRTEPETIFAPGFHEHHTVGFSIPWEACDKDDPGAILLEEHLPGGAETKKCRELIDAVIRSHGTGQKSALKSAALILTLLDEIDIQSRDLQRTSAGVYYVEKAKEYISGHISEVIRQDDVAAYLGITPEYLCHIWKKSEGIPLIPYVNRIKLEKIGALMKRENASLQKASSLYGFADPNYVSRLYKKYFHVNITETIRSSPERPPKKKKEE